MNRKQILSSFKMPMDALTLWQPAASAVMAGHKIYETRDFHPRQVTEFAIHAGKSDSDRCDYYMRRSVGGWPTVEKLPHGVVLGVVRIVALYDLEEFFDYSLVSDLEIDIGSWKLQYAWQLEVVSVFDEPIAARGMPGFWKWHIDADARKQPGAPDWLKDNDGRISPDGSRFID